MTVGTSAIEARPSISIISEKPGPGGRRHRLHAGEGRSDDRADRGELVLGLDDRAACAGHPFGKEMQDLGRGRDRIAGEEPAACVERADRDRLVAGHQEARLGSLEAKTFVSDVVGHRSPEVPAGFERALVGLRQRRSLLGEPPADRRSQRVFRQAEQLGQDAERDDVLRGARSRRVLGELSKWDRDPPRVLSPRKVELLELRLVSRFVKNRLRRPRLRSRRGNARSSPSRKPRARRPSLPARTPRGKRPAPCRRSPRRGSEVHRPRSESRGGRRWQRACATRFPMVTTPSPPEPTIAIVKSFVGMFRFPRGGRAFAATDSVRDPGRRRLMQMN